ncbi:MAG: fibronectin type III domain-containing protein [Actinobacteria bacterium]|nr:fibronectin type III domain-containing protein [Actinomycetota bacterium]
MKTSGRLAGLLVTGLVIALTLGLPVTAQAALHTKPENCYAGIDETQARRCVLVEGRPGQPVVVLFGDSHAMRLSYGVAKVAEQHGFRLILISKSGCPAQTINVNTRKGERYWQCTEWRQSALRLIDSIHPTAVITHSTYLYGALDIMLDSAWSSVPDASEAAAWEAGAAATLERLRGSAAQVLSIRDTPVLGYLQFACLKPEGASSECGATVAEAVPQQALDFWAADSRQALARGVRTLDLNEWFCDDGFCSPWTKKGVVRFSDGDHLTEPFAKTLYKPLAAGLREVLPLAPSPVRSLRITGKGQNTTLKWRKPAVQGSAKVTEYRVSLTPRGSSNRRAGKASCRTPATRCRIHEKLSGDYRIRIRAVSSAGLSPQLLQNHRF